MYDHTYMLSFDMKKNFFYIHFFFIYMVLNKV